ncbi:hypothetical protein V8C26DRAFT_416846 [Trichoderma gracile]
MPEIMALRHGAPLRYSCEEQRSIYSTRTEATLRQLPRPGRSTARTLGLVRYDRPGLSSCNLFTGLEPPSKTTGRRRARGMHRAGRRLDKIVWAACGGHPRNHEADDGMEQLVQANPPPGRSHSTSTACPRCAFSSSDWLLRCCLSVVESGLNCEGSWRMFNAPAKAAFFATL